MVILCLLCLLLPCKHKMVTSFSKIDASVKNGYHQFIEMPNLPSHYLSHRRLS